MKTFILFVILISNSGNESLVAITEKEHKSLISCEVEKKQYSTLGKKYKVFCAEEMLFKRK